MRVIIAIGVSAVLVLSVGTGWARAGLLAGDPNGMGDPWQGTQRFQSSPTPFLVVDVEYCVYAPGQFELSFGFDPAERGDYVYAYQIFNDLSSHPYDPPEDRDYVSGFSVGLTNIPDPLDEPDNEIPITYIDGPGQAPLLSYFAPGTATWKFIPTMIHGLFSDILYYTSPYGPGEDNATVTGYEADTQQLPSPIPEPVTAMLLGAGLAAMVVFRRRKAL